MLSIKTSLTNQRVYTARCSSPCRPYHTRLAAAAAAAECRLDDVKRITDEDWLSH